MQSERIIYLAVQGSEYALKTLLLSKGRLEKTLRSTEFKRKCMVKSIYRQSEKWQASDKCVQAWAKVNAVDKVICDIQDALNNLEEAIIFVPKKSDNYASSI